MTDVSVSLLPPCLCPSVRQQHGISIQSSINLGETLLQMMCEWKPHRPQSWLGCVYNNHPLSYFIEWLWYLNLENIIFQVVVVEWFHSTSSLLHPFTDLPSFTPSLLHSFTPSLLHSFTPSLLHSFTPSHLHSFTPSLLHPFTPSLPVRHLETQVGDSHMKPQGMLVRKYEFNS